MFKLPELHIPQKIYLLIALPIICELVFVATLLAWNLEIERGKRKESFGRSVLVYSKRITHNLIGAVKCAIVFQMSKEDLPLERLESFINKASDDIDELENLCKRNPEYGSQGQSITRKWELPLAELYEVQRLLAVGRTREGIERLERIGTLLDYLNKESDHLFTPFMLLSEVGEKEQEQARQSLLSFLMALLAVSILLAFILVRYFSRNLISRLAVLMENTARLERSEPLHEVLTGQDEIAEFDRVFHKTANAVTVASDKVRRSEAQTKTVIESMPIGVVTVTKDLNLVSANKAASALFGFDAEHGLGGQNLHLSRFLHERVFPEAGLTGKETMAARVSGEEFPAEFSIRDLQGPNLDGYLINVVDISERKKVEQMKQEFLAMVSHDLRSPLSAIKMTLELLAMGNYGEISDKARKKVQTEEANCRRLISLINDLLDAQKLESGRFDIVFEIVDSWTLGERSIASVENLARQAGVRLEMADETNVHFAGDGDRLVQVLINLLSNAVKFSPPEGKVVLSAVQEGDWVVFRVQDQGRGVPEHLRETIFEKFRQAQADDGRKKGGTGLGLAICKGIVESHDGQIGVDSEEGKGSSFWFKIPFVGKLAEL